MKNFFRFSFFIIGFLQCMVLFVFLLPDPYASAYQRAIVIQYEYYKNMDADENKIVFVGNSSLSFGFDLDYMEQLTGTSCAILGNHFSYGLSFVMEMSKSNLNPGDTVIIEIVDTTIDKCGESLLLSGIGHHYEMYKFFIPEVRGKIASYYPSHIKNTVDYLLSGGFSGAWDVYSSDSYDNRGNMIYDRPNCTIPEPYTESIAEVYGYTSFSGAPLENRWVAYVNDYVSYCKKKGVEVYFTLPCYLDESVISSVSDMEAYDNMLRASLDAPLISNTQNYIFERKYMYNGTCHCNNEGTLHRTMLLYEDMKKYNVIHPK